MSGVDMAHKKNVITPKDKFHDQWTMNRFTQTNKSKINGNNIKNKTPKDNTLKQNVWIKPTQIDNLYNEVLTFYHLAIITEKS